MNMVAMSDKAVLEELGRRVQAQRINLNMAQIDLARKAGVSRRAVQNLEGGKSCTVAMLIRVLRVMGKLGQFESFLPEPGSSPLQLAQFKGRERQRASGRRRHATGER